MSRLFVGVLWEQPLIWHRVERVLANRCWQPRGLGLGGGSKTNHPRGWCGGVETLGGASWKGQRQQSLRVETSQGTFQPELFQRASPFSGSALGLCCSCLWVCTRLVMLGPAALSPQSSVDANSLFFQPSCCGNLCILCACCQILLEISLSRKDLFQVYSL